MLVNKRGPVRERNNINNNYFIIDNQQGNLKISNKLIYRNLSTKTTVTGNSLTSLELISSTETTTNKNIKISREIEIEIEIKIIFK